MSFEWQTEEDYNWDELPAPPEPSVPRRRWPWFLLIGLLLAGTAVFLLSRQLNQRIELATDDIEADLIASYAVLQQTAVDRDENLFNSLLSGREPEWVVAQRQNIVAGHLFDRPGFGLSWQPSVVETAVFTTTFSPELDAAELTTLQNYSLDIGNGLTQTVQLRRLDVFRLGEDRWLFAPPEPDFWGVRHRLEGQIVSVRYSSRDETLVHRLAADLEAKLVQFCAAPGMRCPADMQVRLLFATEPESLNETAFIDVLTRKAQGDVLTGGQAIRLPTPTLVGLPQDEVGYQALFRGYAAQMLILAINDATNWQCCDHLPFYQAAVARQLNELGVGSWPLITPRMSLPDEIVLYANSLELWGASSPVAAIQFSETPAPYLFVDFLTADLHIPIAQIVASLASTEDGIFTQWLLSLAGQPWTETTLSDAFRSYLAAQQGQPLEHPQVEADLLLLCHNQARDNLAIYQYDFFEDEPLLLENLDYSEAYFTGLPNGSGLAVVGRRDDGEVETFLLRNGERRTAVNWSKVEGVTSRPPLAIPTITDANGRYLLWTVTQGFATGTFYGLTDLDACHDGDNCQVIPLGGYPVWSPNSDQLLTLTVTNPWWRESLNNGLMLLRPEPAANASNAPGFGTAPFWVNDEQFGYIAQLQNDNQQLMLTDSELNSPRMVIDNDALRASIPEYLRPASLNIQFVSSLPINPDTFLFFAAETDADGDAFLLLYNQVKTETSLLSFLHPTPVVDDIGVRFSPDGRFLLMTIANEMDEDGISSNLLLQAMDGSQPLAYPLLGETPYPRHFYASWSPDGQWLAMPELGYVRLWHNGRDEQLLNFDNLSCTNVAWVDKMQP